jgi:hypothetical protein
MRFLTQKNFDPQKQIPFLLANPVRPLKVWWAWVMDYQLALVATTMLVFLWNQFLFPLSLVFYPFQIILAIEKHQSLLVLGLTPAIHLMYHFLGLYLFQTTFGLYQFKYVSMAKNEARKLTAIECFKDALFSTLSLGSLGALLKLREKCLSTTINHQAHFYQTFQNHYVSAQSATPHLVDWCESSDSDAYEIEKTKYFKKAS